MTEKKKTVEVEVQMRATASLNKSVAEDLKKVDRDMGEVLNEDTKRNDRDRGTGNNKDCDQ